MSSSRTRLVASAAGGIIAFALLTGAARAEEAIVTADAPAEVDEVVVQGFRQSLAAAREQKKTANITSDVIVAEDMAKFPDLNLAESLQRLPGLAINREGGEGRRVSLRGLGPDFTRVQLNGMEVLGNVDSPMDSRGQTSRDRAFDFNIFASELFNKVEVRKSFSAEQDEGGMAGTVGLYTAKPFAYDGRRAALSLQAGTNSATDDFQPRLAGMFSQNWNDTFGVLVSAAYSKRKTQEQGYNTYAPSRVVSGGTNISKLSPTDQALINAGTLVFQRGNRLSVWNSDQERLGLTAAVQWRPMENLTFTLDALHGEFTNDRSELHLATRASQASTVLGGTVRHSGITQAAPTLNAIQYDRFNSVIYADVDNTVFATETRRQNTENKFDQLVLTGEWQLTDRLKIDGHIGKETSDYDIPISDKFYTEAFGGLITDYTMGGNSARNTYKWDTTDPNNYRAHEIDFSATYQSTELENAELNGAFTFSDALTFKAGVSFRGFKNSGYQQATDDLLRTQWENGTVDDRVNNYAKVFDEHDDQSWIIVDWDKALANYGVTRTLGAPRSIYEVQEDTTAGYVQLDWNTGFLGRTLRGNVGLRAYETELTSNGVANVGPISVSNTYSGVLPAFNAVLELTPSLQIRAAAAQNINRPALASYAMNGTVSFDNATGFVTVNVGNPNLEPYTSDEFDLAAEWYFGEVGMLAAGVFHKKIDGFVVSQRVTNVPYSTTGLPDNLIAGVGGSRNVNEFTRPVNLNDAELTGLELSAQTDFFFLPGLLKNAGVVANATFIDSKTTYPNGQTGEIWGMSDLNYNVTVYYETARYGARVSANYRSDYPIDLGGFNETTYVDAAAFYQLTPAIRLTLDAVNLTDEREEQYNDPQARRLWNTTQSGRTIFVGANLQF
ncbi:TonB-dependent receptor [Phenylobacterium deserti]|uniref:TonB-dependent receptor n=1 Tax=Phenylobacterium deserti TaxID=1914756 RepID=A0A328AC74_9CAUL|nr:TonB-dependent receptor [Phenylobacterium deserti]RAK52087.1 TonB-dependent receptor [Phenylobacterium deserti]